MVIVVSYLRWHRGSYLSLRCPSLREGQTEGLRKGLGEGRLPGMLQDREEGVGQGPQGWRGQGQGNGFRAGFRGGENCGYSRGEKSGYSRGGEDGFKRGRKEQCDQGFASGFAQGEAKGLEKGTRKGWETGWDKGTDKGFEKGYYKGGSSARVGWQVEQNASRRQVDELRQADGDKSRESTTCQEDGRIAREDLRKEQPRHRKMSIAVGALSHLATLPRTSTGFGPSSDSDMD